MTDDPNARERPPLGGGATLARLAAIGAVVLGVAGLFAYGGGWFSPGKLTPARFVDGFEAGKRRASGLPSQPCQGPVRHRLFRERRRRARLSKAAIFAPGRVPVTGRFALAGGQPYAADAATTVRSMALRVALPGGEEWRTGMNNIPIFAVSTPEGFYEQLEAGRPDPATGKPDPARMAAFFQRHPKAAKAAAILKNRTISSGFDNSVFQQPRRLPLHRRGRQFDAGALVDGAGAAFRRRGYRPRGGAGQELPLRCADRRAGPGPAAMASRRDDRPAGRSDRRRDGRLARRSRACRCGHADDRACRGRGDRSLPRRQFRSARPAPPASSRPTTRC